MLLFIGFWFILLFTLLNLVFLIAEEAKVWEALFTLALLVMAGLYVFVHFNPIIAGLLGVNLLGLVKQVTLLVEPYLSKIKISEQNLVQRKHKFSENLEKKV